MRTCLLAGRDAPGAAAGAAPAAASAAAGPASPRIRDARESGAAAPSLRPPLSSDSRYLANAVRSSKRGSNRWLGSRPVCSHHRMAHFSLSCPCGDWMRLVNHQSSVMRRYRGLTDRSTLTRALSTPTTTAVVCIPTCRRGRRKPRVIRDGGGGGVAWVVKYTWGMGVGVKH